MNQEEDLQSEISKYVKSRKQRKTLPLQEKTNDTKDNKDTNTTNSILNQDTIDLNSLVTFNFSVKSTPSSQQSQQYFSTDTENKKFDSRLHEFDDIPF